MDFKEKRADIKKLMEDGKLISLVFGLTVLMDWSWSTNLLSTTAWLAQLVGHQSAVQEVEGSRPRPDQHSGS